MLTLTVLVACDWFTYQPAAPPTPQRLVVRTTNDMERVLPDPDHVVIIEAVRSLDWSAYCVAQVRAWQEALPRVEELDAKLLVITSDPPDVLDRMITKRGFESVPIASVSPAVWQQLGIPSDPSRPDLPQTTTLVLQPDGGELLRYGNVDYRERADPSLTLDWIATGKGIPLPEGPEVRSPDWDGAATIGLVREGGELVLDMVMSPGFHVYGTKETTSIPVFLRLADGTRAVVPEGARTQRAGSESWLLEGHLEVRLPVAADQPVSGEVGWQLCNDRTCSAPRHETFALAPDEGRILRPIVK